MGQSSSRLGDAKKEVARLEAKGGGDCNSPNLSAQEKLLLESKLAELARICRLLGMLDDADVALTKLLGMQVKRLVELESASLASTQMQQPQSSNSNIIAAFMEETALRLLVAETREKLGNVLRLQLVTLIPESTAEKNDIGSDGTLNSSSTPKNEPTAEPTPMSSSSRRTKSNANLDPKTRRGKMARAEDLLVRSLDDRKAVLSHHLATPPTKDKRRRSSASKSSYTNMSEQQGASGNFAQQQHLSLDPIAIYELRTQELKLLVARSKSSLALLQHAYGQFEDADTQHIEALQLFSEFPLASDSERWAFDSEKNRWVREGAQQLPKSRSSFVGFWGRSKQLQATNFVSGSSKDLNAQEAEPAPSFIPGPMDHETLEKLGREDRHASSMASKPPLNATGGSLKSLFRFRGSVSAASNQAARASPEKFGQMKEMSIHISDPRTPPIEMRSLLAGGESLDDSIYASGSSSSSSNDVWRLVLHSKVSPYNGFLQGVKQTIDLDPSRSRIYILGHEITSEKEMLRMKKKGIEYISLVRDNAATTLPRATMKSYGASISSRHAILTFGDGYAATSSSSSVNGWTIEDCSSDKGVLLNGIRIKRGVMREGDEVVFGGYASRVKLGSMDDPKAKKPPSDEQSLFVFKCERVVTSIDQSILAGIAPSAIFNYTTPSKQLAGGRNLQGNSEASLGQQSPSPAIDSQLSSAFQHFHVLCVSAQMNLKMERGNLGTEAVTVVESTQMFQRACELGIPFNLWASWIQSELVRRRLNDASSSTAAPAPSHE